MKKILDLVKKRFISKIRRNVGRALQRLEHDPIIIVHIDGGISSQIFRYALGQHLGEKLCCDVEYEMKFFLQNGKDISGVEKRDFNLLRCFPDIQFRMASGKKLSRYEKYFDWNILGYSETVTVGKEISTDSISKPFIIQGYTADVCINIWEYINLFNWDKIYNVLNSNSKRTADTIKHLNAIGIKTVGVHVRRGDMALTGYNWKVLTSTYFFKAIDHARASGVHIFFFSNGMDYVRREILPCYNFAEMSYSLVENFDEDYGDIYNLSLCQTQIGSQGSWGSLAFLFNKNSNRYFITDDIHFPNGDEYYKLCKDRILKIELTPSMFEQ